MAAWALTALAQEAAPLPSGDEVIDRHVQALGGKQAIEAIATRAAMGTVQSPTFGSSGRYGEFFKAPDRLLRAYHVEHYGVVQQCFDGKAGWMETPEYGLEELTGPRLQEMRRDAGFENPLRWRARYSRFVAKGRTKVEDRDAIEVLATSADGPNETWFFAADTGLLICRESPETARDGSSRLVRTYYEDYRETSGIQAAHTLRHVSPDLIRIVRRAVANNAPVDDSRFKRP
ncbi:MAG: hypothetical protein ACKV22_34630 [Bryobacteraceae bacterium]